MNAFDKIIPACSDLLRSYDGATEAREYVNKRLSEETQGKFGFGYIPPSESFEALSSLIGDDVISDSGLMYDNVAANGMYRKTRTHFFEHHNLIMPYRNCYGGIVAIVGRTIYSEAKMKRTGTCKYKNTKFKKSMHVFGLYEARAAVVKHDCVFVVEGQFDVIKAHDNGIYNVVALGSSSMTMYQLSLLLRYTKNIYLYLDNDEAGRIGSEKILKRFSSYGKMKDKCVPFGYKDLDEYLADAGRVSVRDLISL
jgi:DNA primase